MESELPPELAKVYTAAKERAVDSGATEQVATDMGLRAIQHAGWYLTSEGWQQLSPDVRDRVQVRQAIPQPTGQSLIRNVLCFYANAVKEDDPYDQGMVRSIIDNTNRALQSGSQTVGIIKTHPNPINKAVGKFPKLYGEAFNFREPMDKPGWVECDLLVNPELADEWKQKQITGLSVGIFGDAGGLNRRIGHVAAMGAETQALSALPRTEVFASSRMVCFAAEPFETGSKMTKSQCYAAMAAAYAAKEAGEEGADAKLAEAKKMFDAMAGDDAAPNNMADPNVAQTDSVATGGNPVMATGDTYGSLPDIQNKAMWAKVPKEKRGKSGKGEYKDMDSEWSADSTGKYAATGPSDITQLPEKTKLDESTGSADGTVVVGEGRKPEDYATGYSAEIVSQFSAMHEKIKRQDAVLAQLLKDKQQSEARAMHSEFQAFCAAENAMGRNFSAEQAASLYSAVISGDKGKAADAVRKFIKALPATESLSSFGSVFSADQTTIDTPAARGKMDPAKLAREFTGTFQGQNFSADDLSASSALEAAMYAGRK